MPWLMLTDGNDDDDVHPSYLSMQLGLLAYPDQYYIPRLNKREIRCKMNKNTNNGEEGSLCCQRSMLNLSRNRSKCYNLNLHEINERVCWGSPYGWVVTLGLDREMSLFNPLTKAQLPLPPQTTFPNSWSWRKADDTAIRNFLISKAVLLQVPRKYCHSSTINEASLCDNGNSIWLVVTIYSMNRFLAIAKPGDKAWIPIELGGPYILDGEEEILTFDNVIFWPNMSSLLFLEKYREDNLFICDIRDIKNPQMLKQYLSGPPIAEEHLGYILYLVECMGNILVIIKVYKVSCKPSGRERNPYFKYNTLFFEVYKLDMLTKNWNEVQDLQKFALFVGRNVSMAIVADDAGCQRNCIYFCDDMQLLYFRTKDKAGGHDMGIYNMSSGIIEPLYTGLNSRSSYCCPFWFSPSI